MWICSNVYPLFKLKNMNEMENMELEAVALATIINEAIEQAEQAPSMNLEEALESLREL